MPVKIRLQRQGRKFRAIYSIVVADSRAPRDGKYIANLGQYNPNTNPASIELDFDKAMEWLQNGAQPTDTCRAILSYKGVLYKKHLLDGVKNGAFDEAEAEKRFQIWLTEKEQKHQAKHDKIKMSKEEIEKEKMDHESKVREDRALAIAKRNSELVEAEKKAAAGEEEEEVEVAEGAVEAAEGAEEVAEAAAPEAAPVAEEVKEELKEEAKEEVKEEAKEEPKEEAKEESKEEAKAEPKKDSKDSEEKDAKS